MTDQTSKCIIKANTLNETIVITSGKKELQENRFFQFLDTIMGDPKTRSYIDEFFGNWDEIKTVMMFIKVYQVVDSQLQSNCTQFKNQETRRSFIIGIVKELIIDSNCRQEIIANMARFMENDFTQCNLLIQYKTK
jgi:hypothetical protein